MTDDPAKCWLCQGYHLIYESQLCFECYSWAETNTPADATEEQIKEAYAKAQGEPECHATPTTQE